MRRSDPDKADDAVERRAAAPSAEWAYSRAVSLIPFGLFVVLCAVYGASQALFVGSTSVYRGWEKEAILARLTEFAAPAERTAAQQGSKPPSHNELRALPVQTVIERFNGRLTWVLFTGLSVFASLVSVFAAVVLTKAAWSAGGRRPWAAAGGVLLAGAAVMALVVSNPDANMPFMYDMLRVTVAVERVTGMRALPDVMNVLTAFSIGVAVSLAITCLVLIFPRHRSPPSADTAEALSVELSALERTALYLRVFLYVSTAGLVAGILRMNSTITWMESFLTNGHALFDTLRATTVGMMGVFYTLLLACLYVPSVLIVSERARAVVSAAHVTSAVKAAARERAVFNANVSGVVMRVVVILGPVLAGPVGEFLKHLAEKS